MLLMMWKYNQYHDRTHEVLIDISHFNPIRSVQVMLHLINGCNESSPWVKLKIRLSPNDFNLRFSWYVKWLHFLLDLVHPSVVHNIHCRTAICHDLNRPMAVKQLSILFLKSISSLGPLSIMMILNQTLSCHYDSAHEGITCLYDHSRPLCGCLKST